MTQPNPFTSTVSVSGGSATTRADVIGKVKAMTPAQKRALALALLRKKKMA